MLKKISGFFLNLLFKNRYAIILAAAYLLSYPVASLTTAILGASFVPYAIVAICVPFWYFSSYSLFSYEKKIMERQAQINRPLQLFPSTTMYPAKDVLGPRQLPNHHLRIYQSHTPAEIQAIIKGKTELQIPQHTFQAPKIR